MIVSQFDTAYLDWAHLFLQSLFFTNPNERVYFNTVNLSDDQIKKFSTYGNKIIIENIHCENVTKNFMVNRRVQVYLDVIKKNLSDMYIFCDVDLLFRKPLLSFRQQMSNCDAGVIFRSGNWMGNIYEHLKVAAGIIAVKPEGYCLIDNWNKILTTEDKVNGINKGEWYFDQITLWEATKITHLKYSLIEEFLYINSNRDPEAFIWSANRPPKELMYKLFIKEFERIKNGQKRKSINISR